MPLPIRRLLAALLPLAALTLAMPAWAALSDDLEAAREAARMGRHDRLAELADKLDGTVLAVYPRYWLLSAQIDTRPQAEIEAFLNQQAGSLLADRLRGDWLRAMGKRGDWSGFEREWPKLIQWEPGSELHCWRLQLAVAQDDRSTLRQAKPLWFSAKPLPDACGPVFDALFRIGVLDQDDVWARIRLALQANNPDFAAQLVPRLTRAEGLDAKRLRDVAAKPARMLPRLDLAQRGARELALFGLMRLAREDLDEAAAWLARLRLPQAERAYAWHRLAVMAARRLDPRASDWFARGGDFDDEALEWRTRAALRAGDWAGVLAAIDAMSESARGQAAWRYWRARAEAALGRTAAAEKHYAELADEHHFYALLAREEVTLANPPDPPRYRPSDGELNAIRQLPGVARALALYQLDWRLEAVREWNWAMRGLSDKQLLAAAEVARQVNWYDRAIFSAERTRELHDFSLRFIAPYRDVTRTYARQAGLDEAWVYGLIRQESRFVVNARSSVGAGGLMQLMPATAKWVAKKLGMPGFQPTAVNDIGTNVQLGTYYLRHVYDALGGNAVLATAAYNAGPGRARGWRAAKPLEGAIYAETIPFSETRDYVKKVMANAIYYAQALGQGETSLKRRLGTVPARDGTDLPLDDTP
jgi:soluble lytic murein transglycosylase